MYVMFFQHNISGICYVYYVIYDIQLKLHAYEM